MMRERIEKWKQMEAAGDKSAFAYLQQITAEAKTEGKIQEMNEALEFLANSADKRLDEIEESVTNYTIYEQLGALAEVINLAYIARHYFGKSRQWLYQRIKGYNVNGKPAKFSEEERRKFIGALNEIGFQLTTATNRIGA